MTGEEQVNYQSELTLEELAEKIDEGIEEDGERPIKDIIEQVLDAYEIIT